ncbi:MAG: glycosyltransferase [Chitinivibrionales bacterium]|nr:glycosyltransferase [Chitinivibrionales bacterium]
MKILFFNYVPDCLGPLIRTFELANAVKRRNHDVVLYYRSKFFSPPVPFVNFINNARHAFPILFTRNGTKNTHKPASSFLLPLSRLQRMKRSFGLIKRMLSTLSYLPHDLRILSRLKPDVLVVYPAHFISFVFAAKLCRIPVVMDVDGPAEELDMYYKISTAFVRPFDIARAHYIDSILSISHESTSLWLKKGIPAEKIFLCENGADPAVFQPGTEKKRAEIRFSLGIGNKIVLGFSGVMAPWHGMHLFLSHAENFLSEHPDVCICIIGPDKRSSFLPKQHLLRDDTQKKIIFTGAIPYDEMPQYIDILDILIMPYIPVDLFYFSPMKMYECLALNKIIVASRMGQLHSVLQTVSHAFLYDPKLPPEKGMYASIEQALLFLKHQKNAPREGREMIDRHHSWAIRGNTVLQACEYAIKKMRKKSAP